MIRRALKSLQWIVLILLLIVARSLYFSAPDVHPALAQLNPPILPTGSNPAGLSCSNTTIYLYTPSGVLYTCVNGVETAIGSASGSVTSVSFTGGLISVANPTSTPAFTVAGLSGGVPYFASGSTWASSAAGTAGHLVLWGGAGTAPTDGGAPPVSPTANQNIRTIGASFGSFQTGATALSGNQTACVPVYTSGTIQAVKIIGNVSGSASIDVQTVAHSSWTGVSSASSITASATPALSSASKYTDTTLTGWTTSVTADTDFCFVMTSPSTVAGLSITLKVAAN